MTAGDSGAEDSATEVVAMLYVSFDGAGVPVIKRETAGRRGKSATGEAHTREVKLGCVFTQTMVDELGHPGRVETATACRSNRVGSRRYIKGAVYLLAVAPMIIRATTLHW